MKQKWVVLAVCAALTGFGETKPLKEAYEGKFKIGVALNDWQFSGRDSAAKALIVREFNSITAENCMKSAFLQPQEGVFRFDRADRFVAFGETNHMKIIGHTLIWHSQAPRWFFQSPDRGPLTKECLQERMKKHIQTVVGHYKGRVHGWDVVNEAVEDNGSYRRSPFYNTFQSDEFIKLAFRYAHEADPDAELYYNDYGMFRRGKRETVARLVKAMKAEGIRIDGVGMQGHISLDRPSLEEYEASIRAFRECGVKVMFTELDVSVLPARWRLSADVSQNVRYDKRINPWPDGLPEEVQKRLGERYAALFTLFLKYKDDIDRVTFWGLSDGESWLNNFPVRGRTDYPLLFDRKRQRKPFTLPE
ncbi:MAG: endo-1,4-beta-xylanase [Kiritimatiellae bacterium]|nr:endo-1,4-beta-xylanase [Kiritimatiellia bacterium]